MTERPRTTPLTGLVWPLAAATVWGLLTAWHPHITYHLGPAAVVLAGPLSSVAGNRCDLRRHLRSLAASLIVALVAGVVLDSAGLMLGPTLLGVSAGWEALIIGACAGLTAAVIIWWATKPTSRS